MDNTTTALLWFSLFLLIMGAGFLLFVDWRVFVGVVFIMWASNMLNTITVELYKKHEN